MSERLSPDDVIWNLSSYTLSKSEKEALALGLNYAFRTTKVLTAHVLKFKMVALGVRGLNCTS